MDKPQRIHLSIDSTFSAISLAGIAIRGFCSLIPLSDLESHRMELAVIEIITNAIKHAYNGEEDHSIDIEYTNDGSTLQITVINTGSPMEEDPSIFLKAASDQQSLLKEGGRGLYIVHAIMDTVTVTQVNDQNMWTLTKKIGTAAE